MDSIESINQNTYWWSKGSIDSLFLDNCIAVVGSTNFAKDIPKENTTIVFDNERRNREIMIQVKQIIDKGYNVVLYLTM